MIRLGGARRERSAIENDTSVHEYKHQEGKLYDFECRFARFGTGCFYWISTRVAQREWKDPNVFRK